MEQSPSWEADISSADQEIYFCTDLYSQEHCADLYPDPDESNPRPYTLIP
jgi:hypothetical protein